MKERIYFVLDFVKFFAVVLVCMGAFLVFCALIFGDLELIFWGSMIMLVAIVIYMVARLIEHLLGLENFKY